MAGDGAEGAGVMCASGCKVQLERKHSPEAERFRVYDPGRQKPVEIKAPPQASFLAAAPTLGSLPAGPAESVLPLSGEGARGRFKLKLPAGPHLFGPLLS